MVTLLFGGVDFTRSSTDGRGVGNEVHINK
jgi:hypothetical protein